MARGARLAGWLGAGLLVAGLMPVILPALAMGLVWLGGCEVRAVDDIPPCHVAGMEITGMLRIVAFAPWLIALTWPLALAGAGLLAIAGLIALVRWARSGR